MSRDHSIECETCGVNYGGINDLEYEVVRNIETATAVIERDA